MSATAEATGRSTPAVVIPQYSRGQILRLWLAATIPMGVLAWVVAPLLARVWDGPAALRTH
jgi:uncharacterized protein